MSSPPERPNRERRNSQLPKPWMATGDLRQALQPHCLLQLQGEGRDRCRKRRKETGPEREGSFILHRQPNFPGSCRSCSFPASPGAARESTPRAGHGRSHHKYPYQYLRASAVQAFGKQRGKTQRPSRRSAGQPQACPHHVPRAWQHQAQMLSPFDSIHCPALPPEMPGEEAAAPGFSTPDDNLNTRTRTQISGGRFGHSDHMGPSTLGTPHGSHPSPTPNMTLLEDKSVQACLVEPCLCPAHPGGGGPLRHPPSQARKRHCRVSLLCLP